MPDLFAPALAGVSKPPAIYSTQATFFTSFIGGPIAAGLFAALNARHARRLPRDAPVLVAAVVGGLLIVLLALWVRLAPPPGFPEELRSARMLRFAARFAGIVTWAVLYLRHRTLHRATDLAGVPARSAWAAALVCIALGAASQFGLVLLIGPLLAP